MKVRGGLEFHVSQGQGHARRVLNTHCQQQIPLSPILPAYNRILRTSLTATYMNGPGHCRLLSLAIHSRVESQSLESILHGGCFAASGLTIYMLAQASLL